MNGHVFNFCPLDSLVAPGKPIVYGIVQAGEHDPDGVPYIRSTDVGEAIDANTVLRTNPAIAANYHRSVVSPGDIVFSLRGNIGESSLVPRDLAGANLTQGTARISVSESHDGRYVRYALKHTPVIRRILAVAKGSTFHEITLGDLRQIEIPCPPLPEQRKIADILTTWDEALTQLDALIEAQERRKKALMQQLLTGRRRLKPHGVSIKHLKASEIFTNRSERNTGALPVLSVTQDQGIVLRSSLERRIAHDEDNINTYKVVRAGDYVISLRSFQGGLEYSEVTGAVSPAYHVIRPIKEIDQSFYRHYFKSTDFISRLAIATIGIRDGKQISFTDFGFIKLPYPAIEDQKRIGAILDTADQQLTLFRAQRSALDQQKRGLMQRLLTGQIRVRP